MAALEKLYINKGKAFLNDAEIQDFIPGTKIGTAFGVTRADVKKDLQTIDRKWNPPVSGSKSRKSGTYAVSGSKVKLTTYQQYMDALEVIYIQNRKKLTYQQIAEFITDNAIGSCFGVTMADVKHDLQDIEKKKNAAAALLRFYVTKSMNERCPLL